MHQCVGVRLAAPAKSQAQQSTESGLYSFIRRLGRRKHAREQATRKIEKKHGMPMDVQLQIA